MTSEQLQELEEKAKLWDSLSDTLRTIFCGKFERPSNGTTTIENTSNASSHIGLLEEESKEMVTTQICQNCIIPSTDWCGKCFKCDKQVFKRINA
jgi:hypothetical protein